ncbi:hypothetical protein BDA96_10G206600 [Sorghum bicolor]|uniref:Uncharacterized protein n=2 Tax=Sorghum bicolor TaxID=4558 RepID=A0A194YKK0_SORBI|nr:hypothetical protein BDA96_10G206600 [Sorghum bicolor]KXG20121.1 hypothetical protein SORBI_3010G157900 [Sorghum bicolor]
MKVATRDEGGMDPAMVVAPSPFTFLLPHLQWLELGFRRVGWGRIRPWRSWRGPCLPAMGCDGGSKGSGPVHVNLMFLLHTISWFITGSGGGAWMRMFRMAGRRRRGIQCWERREGVVRMLRWWGWDQNIAGQRMSWGRARNERLGRAAASLTVLRLGCPSASSSHRN